MPQTELIAQIQSTPVRRLSAYGAVMGLGLLIVWLALTQPPALGWQVFLLIFGAVCLYLAEHLRRATLLALRLTDEGLEDSSGQILASYSDMARVDRSPFAFKPSNGFVLHLKEKAPTVWMPGLYWRYGRRIGVGGTLPSGAARFMADQIALELANRQPAVD